MHRRAGARTLVVASALILALAVAIQPHAVLGSPGAGAGHAGAVGYNAKATSCTPLDVALVVDDTGSMGPAIRNVKESLGKLITDTEQAGHGNFRMELVTFKDTVQVDVPFAHDDGLAMRAGVRKLRASGGDDEPEASDEAIRTAVDALPATAREPGQQEGDAFPMRTKADKLVILVTDARPGGFDDAYDSTDAADAAAVAKDAADRGVRIASVFEHTQGGLGTARSIAEGYAKATGGYFRDAKGDGSDTAIAVRTAIILCGQDYSVCHQAKTTAVGTVTGEALAGTAKRDVVAGLGGDDTMKGGRSGDTLCGDGGHDVVRGSKGDDTIHGGPQGDSLYGGDGHDRLYGSGGYDRIYAAGGGRDTVDCGSGEDTVYADGADRVHSDCETVIRR